MKFSFSRFFQRANYLNVRIALRFKGYPVEDAERIFYDTLKQNNYTAYHEQMKWEIFHFHLNTNENYKKLCKVRPSEWKGVPTINRKVLNGSFRAWIPQEQSKNHLFKGSTSGSSGIPFEFARDKLSHALIWASIEYFYAKANVKIFESQARFYGVLLSRAGQRLARIKDLVANRYRFNVYDVTEEAILSGLECFQRKKFRYIYGYSNTLLAYANYLLQKKLVLKQLCPTLKSCVVTSEYCSESEAFKIEQAFGIPVYNEYGSAEMGIIGFKRGIEREWEVPNNLLYVEVLDDEGNILPDGETGLLTYTHLYNRATPLIRYQTGDVGSISRDVTGKITLMSLEGRIGDIVRLSNGKLITTFTFYYVVKDLISKGAQIQEFVVEQMADDSFVLKYVANKELSEELKQVVNQVFKQYVSTDYPVDTLRVSVIERGANGKFRHFISKKNEKE